MLSVFFLVLSEYLVDICMIWLNVECLCLRDFKLYWRVFVCIMWNVLYWLFEIIKKCYYINVRSRYVWLFFLIVRKVVFFCFNFVNFYDFLVWCWKCCLSVLKCSFLIGKNYYNIMYLFYDNIKVFVNFFLIFMKWIRNSFFMV